MICKQCCLAGDLNSQGDTEGAEHYHERCVGHCDCMHRTGKGWINPNDS